MHTTEDSQENQDRSEIEKDLSLVLIAPPSKERGDFSSLCTVGVIGVGWM